jgi:hypothetical protein
MMRVKTYGRHQNLWLTSEHMTRVRTYGRRWNLWLMSELLTCVRTYDATTKPTNTLQPFGLMLKLMTRVGTYSASARAILHIGSYDVRHNFGGRILRTTRTTVRTSNSCHNLRHLKSWKNIFCAREVLECLFYDLVVMLEHSIFLSPIKFASPFIVQHSLNSRVKR